MPHICSAEEIYKWVDQNGVENYSNDPTQVPYGNWVESTKKKNDVSNSKDTSDSTKQTLDNTAGLPDVVKKQYVKFTEAERKLQDIINSKKEELENMKKQKDSSKEEQLKLENFILQAEDRLKLVQEQKIKFLKRNNLNSDT